MRYNLEVRLQKSKCRRVEHGVGRGAKSSPHVAVAPQCFGWWRHQGHVVLVYRDGLLGPVVGSRRSPPVQGIVVDGIIAGHHNISRPFVYRHAPHRAPRVFDRLRGLSLAFPEDVDLEDPGGSRDEERRDFLVYPYFDARYGLVRLVYDALFRAGVVNQVASDQGYRAVREADGQLGKVFRSGECRYLTCQLESSADSRAAYRMRLLAVVDV